MNGPLQVGSLFAGIGGFDLGFERAGMQTVWQVEQNPYCRAVLERHFPDAQRFEDVCEVGAAELQPVDVICGGFPCQDISLAGKGAGLDGARSGLWSEYARIVRELEPRWVVVENVPALLSRGLDRVLRDLAAIGYDAEWDCLPAAAFGAPHRRDRIWLIAYPDARRLQERQERDGESLEPREQAPLRSDFDGLRDHVADPDCVGWQGWSGYLGTLGGSEPADGGPDVADAPGDRRRQGRQGRPARDGQNGQGLPTARMEDADERALQPWRVGGRAAQTGGAEWWAVEPPVGRVAHGVPARLDRLAALGNALVPQISQWIGERIVNFETAEMPEAAA